MRCSGCSLVGIVWILQFFGFFEVYLFWDSWDGLNCGFLCVLFYSEVFGCDWKCFFKKMENFVFVGVSDGVVFFLDLFVSFGWRFGEFVEIWLSFLFIGCLID